MKEKTLTEKWEELNLKYPPKFVSLEEFKKRWTDISKTEKDGQS